MAEQYELVKKRSMISITCTSHEVTFEATTRKSSISGIVEFEVAADYDFGKPTCVNYAVEGRAVFGPYKDIREKLDFEYHGCACQRRQELQDLLIQDVIGTGVRQDHPWIVFTAGAMGAGKSHAVHFMSREGCFPLSNVAQIDLDQFRCKLPEWLGYLARSPETAGYLTHRESGCMMEIAQEAALRNCKNIWIDGSLRDHVWYAAVFEGIRKNHPQYRIAIFHVTASWETTCQRAAARAKTTGRVVPDRDLWRSFEQVPVSVEKLSTLADLCIEIENDSVPTLKRFCALGQTYTSGSWEQVRQRFATLPEMRCVYAGSKLDCIIDEAVARPVVIFSKTWCSFCSKVKAIISQQTQSLKSERDLCDVDDFYALELDTMTCQPLDKTGGNSVDAPCQVGGLGVALQMQLAARTAQTTVPYVFINGEFIGGCDTIIGLHQDGRLAPLLALAHTT
mmetsp:Transcript_17498/g.47935  ORF Transcript_17498/g.47935 Transcript_17498/m.47935 type:complete len:451 (+) Transcript_17498:174-1526(+)